MRSAIAQLSLFAVALLIGLLLVAQLRSQQRPVELASLSATELSTLVDTLSQRNRELRSGLADLTEQVRSYSVAQTQGESSLELGKETLRRLRAFGGLGEVRGQGMVVRVSGALDAIAVNDLINELRNAGAEAISIDAVRITARSVAVQGPSGAIVIDGTEIGSRFVIRAIGDPDGLDAALNRPGGIKLQLQLYVAAEIDAQQQRDIVVPATRLDLQPSVARAVGSGS